ncbi:diacylglycerol kinase family protein [Flammeovirga sp. SJP92]|uniref:diacylglycerol/lipid kinase family protein n=1 Tax=Flammeovirga sp. SJP92 TaxID=1775430 RepID=UPI000789419C|nr:diacylglycerol kinase family protein [Flammeovirga sp. SJP92]KXX70280.1 hypothetical protein AVL50_11785 [Flammeovirga sp. SJP92]
MPNIILITNPKSGNGAAVKAAQITQQALASKSINVHIAYTEYTGHASLLAKSFVNDFDIIVAIGGDTTVNEVAQALVGTDKLFGIIPCGADNRLAQHFGIPVRLKKAIKIIYNQKVKNINAPLINDQYFFCNAGVGFDALMGKNLKRVNGKVLINYIKAIFKDFQNHFPDQYTININGQEITSKAFLITITDSDQFEKESFGSSSEKINNGNVKAKILFKPSIRRTINSGFRFFKKKSPNEIYLQSDDFVINSDNKHHEILGHKDGEQRKWSTPLNFKIRREDRLNVIVN